MKKFILILFALMLAAGALAACPDGMISYWTFNSSTYKFNDDYGENHLTCTNCPVWNSSGKVAGALLFDGQNDRMQLSLTNKIFKSDAYTLEAWVYPTKAGYGTHNQGIISNDAGEPLAGIELAVGQDPYKVSCTFTNDTMIGDKYGKFSVSAPMIINAWHHIACTYDGSELSLYIDGIIAANTLASGQLVKDNNYNFEIGRSRVYGGSNLEHFAGLIDEAAIYDRALYSYEIKIHYDNGLQNKSYCEAAQKSEKCSDGNCSLGNATKTYQEESEVINQPGQEAEATPNISKITLVVSILIILIAVVGAFIIFRKKK